MDITRGRFNQFIFQIVENTKKDILTLLEEIYENEQRRNERINRKYTCDNCNVCMSYPAAKIEFGYGSKNDGKTYYFCSDKCLKKALMRQLISIFPAYA